ncbi:MAG: hypothetical protein FWF92_08755 [Oscillospiraceae bacterium]|nr:hypothetical protein [Oscillospiraceae bacterium]
MFKIAKELLTNKKFLIGLIVIALGVTIILSGITGAWWYITSDDDASLAASLDMGNLEVLVELIGPAPDKVYHPGDEQSFSVAVENKGSADAFVKLDFIGDDDSESGNVKVHIKSDVIEELTKPSNEYIDFEGDSFCLYMDSGNNIYLALYGETTVTLKDCVTVNLIGGSDDETDNYSDEDIGMKNDTMNSTVEITLEWEATQAIREAVLAKFGIDMFDLDIIAFE